MITFVTFKWKPRPGYRSNFYSGHVNVMRSMLDRCYNHPHRVICITDDPEGLDPRVEAVPLWDDYAHIPNPTWPDGPSCYRRLKVFSYDFERIAGKRFACVDLDMVLTDDVAPIFDRKEDFVAFKSHLAHIPLCGSLFMMTAGTQSFVWRDFNPATSPALAHRAGCRGSDQGWMNYCYRDAAPYWSNKDGVYSYMELAPKRREKRGRVLPPPKPGSAPLPPDARIVVFTGKPDPWDHAARTQSPWIDDHYR